MTPADREALIAQVMEESGESREIVTEALDAIECCANEPDED